MPISDDEFEYRPSQTQESQISSMSKAELRKTHKPIMEKRRRARINHCLNEIKTLILEAMNKDPARHSKLEKADILEMAVKHLQNVQRQQLTLAMATDPSVLRKFKTGFNECASEIDRYVNEIDGVDSSLKDRMKSHLEKCISGIEQVVHFNFPTFPALPFMTTANVYNQSSKNPESRDVDDPNNNARIQIPQGIQLIPSRLPSGEIALLLPNSGNLPFLPQLAQPRERSSAFSTVIPCSSSSTERLPSPPLSPHCGFRPVSLFKPQSYQILEEQSQVPQISSSTSIQPVEVKPIKFPIHNYLAKEKRTMSPKKSVEPLCIITNQSERFKQAQTPEDSVACEENRQQGVKRKCSELSQGQGLLSFAPQDFSHPVSKILKVEPSSSADECNNKPSTSRDSGESSDMWRPW